MKASFVVLVISSILGLGVALRCYDCIHSTYPEDNDYGIPNDPSCKNADPKHIIDIIGIENCNSRSIQQKTELMQKNHPQLKLKNLTLSTHGKQAYELQCEELIYTDGRYDVVIRGCRDYYPGETEANYCEACSNTKGQKEKSCVCNTDACNSNTNA